MTSAIPVRDLQFHDPISGRSIQFFAAKDLIQHLLCVDPAQRYTIDEFLAHPWCNAAPAPPPPPTPHVYSSAAPLDSPLLTAVHGRVEGRSPGLASLKEAFDITYAVHRMEEEGARRRAYNGRGGAGRRGLLGGLNEDDEDEEDDKEVEDARRKHGDVVGRAVEDGGRQVRSAGAAAVGYAAGEGQKAVADRSPAGGKGLWEGGRAGQRDRGGRRNVGSPKSGAGLRGFELDLDGATLLGRRHKKGGLDPSPLAGKPIWPYDDSENYLPPGSPMRVN